MRILLYTPHRDAHDWKRDVERALPGAQLRTWTPGDDASADYALVWRAPREFRAARGFEGGVQSRRGRRCDTRARARASGLLPRDVPLVRLEDAGMARQMVEYATHAALRYLRRFDEYALLQRERRWQVLAPHARETFVVGVLGLGALGAEVARALAALGLPVRGYSRAPKAIDGVTTFAGAAQLDAFLGGAKLLVNLLPSTAATDGILNARTFSKLAHGAYLVNLARGAHLVEADLLDALASGRVAAATLDVFATEPLPPDHPFWHEPRITITPHCSADTLRAEAVGQIAAKIGALERGEPIGGIVDRDRGY